SSAYRSETLNVGTLTFFLITAKCRNYFVLLLTIYKQGSG
ncbi:hypothetical protein LEP1GSC116_0663, partial [Leptospira interrogans serovar Icterohaemorrhagiae str. Verdun HP]